MLREDTQDRRRHQEIHSESAGCAARHRRCRGQIRVTPALAPDPAARQSRPSRASPERGAAMTANPRWKRRPPGSTWGDFGPDDQRGRLNLLTPKKVLEGIAEVKEGRAFCLSLPLDYPGGNKL